MSEELNFIREFFYGSSIKVISPFWVLEIVCWVCIQQFCLYRLADLPLISLRYRRCAARSPATYRRCVVEIIKSRRDYENSHHKESLKIRCFLKFNIYFGGSVLAFKKSTKPRRTPISAVKFPFLVSRIIALTSL